MTEQDIKELQKWARKQVQVANNRIDKCEADQELYKIALCDERDGKESMYRALLRKLRTMKGR